MAVEYASPPSRGVSAEAVAAVDEIVREFAGDRYRVGQWLVVTRDIADLDTKQSTLLSAIRRGIPEAANLASRTSRDDEGRVALYVRLVTKPACA